MPSVTHFEMYINEPFEISSNAAANWFREHLGLEQKGETAGQGAGTQTPQTATAPFDHVHLAVSDPAKAAEWYIKYMGGAKGPGANEVTFGSTLLMFQKVDGAGPSAGSVIDHIGFSFSDLDAKMKELQAPEAGARVTMAVRDAPNLFKLGFIEDPWGAKIRSEEHTSELQSLRHLVCRLLLEKNKEQKEPSGEELAVIITARGTSEEVLYRHANCGRICSKAGCGNRSHTEVRVTWQ